MQRIRLEILRAGDDAQAFYFFRPVYKLWMLELVEDDEGLYKLYRYYGTCSDSSFTKKLDLTAEYIDDGLKAFETKVAKKLKSKKFRKFFDGENIFSPTLMKILKPDAKTPVKKGAAERPLKKVEYRQIQL